MISDLVRKNILALKPYTSARDEFEGEASVYLDANENSLGSVANGSWNRYPDPYQSEVKLALGKLKGISPKNIFLGNGSDEAIDLLYRIFCNPGSDKALLFPPTYGMYEVSANINNIEVLKLELNADFQLPLAQLKTENTLASPNLKLLFVCSPNNPTGNLINKDDIIYLLNNFKGIVVVDEAYIDFAPGQSFVNRLAEFPNLVILQTFSKAWGMAALRLGIAYASEEIISLFNKVKPPYNINESTQQLALTALNNAEQLNTYLNETLALREKLITELGKLVVVKKIYPTAANFVLCEVDDANALYQKLISKGIVVRNRHSVVNNCLRITIGTAQENSILLSALNN